MAVATLPADRAAKTGRVREALLAHYGTPRRYRQADPLSELVGVILSQHTSDQNSGRAYDTLVARFPTWAEVRDAPVAAVADAIRSGGLAVVKAPRIQAVLRAIEARYGRLSLDFLRELPLDEARAVLTSLPGVGPKSAACVLLFSCDRPALPVDTHVHRVARRLGLIPPGTTAERAHDLLERIVPPDAVYDFHVNLIRHGRETCAARRPHCETCILREDCEYLRGLSTLTSDG
ncbi:MAG: endonuclease III [Chloroflexi bacterium]|nr:endonuclease III [Chloroflexota bacterium]